jgi:flagellar hook-associated protein 1 FlgK
MSLISALSNAMSGLAVAQHALDVTANNVANVNTEGYSRKLVHQEAVVLDGRGAGTRALDPTRAADEFLSARILEQETRLGRSGTLETIQDATLERVLGAPGEANRGLGARIGRLTAATEALAASPDKGAQKLDYLAALQGVAGEITTAGAEVQLIRREVDQQIVHVVDEINTEIAALHDLNVEIVRSGARGELLDRRDALLQSLSGKLDLAVASRDNGASTIYTRGGLPLLEESPRQLVYAPAATVGAGTSFGAIKIFRADEVDAATGDPLPGANGDVLVSGGIRSVLTPELLADGVPDATQRIVSPLQGGKLQGLLEARDKTLPGLSDQLAELAELARHALNAAHNASVAQPPPSRLVGTRTDSTDFAAATRSGTAYLAVVDRGTGAVAATIAIDVGAAASPAALAGQLNAALGTYGSATLNADGALELNAAAGFGLATAEGDSAIEVTDAAGHIRQFGFSHYFGLNDLLVRNGGAATDLAVRPDLLADPGLLSRAKLDIEPGPPLTSSLGGVGDNRGVIELAGALESKVQTVARGGVAAGSYRFADYAADIVAAAATGAAAAKSEAGADRSLAEDLKVRQANVSGVNLDEELSRLMIYQQAYSVSARLVSIVDELFDQLMAIGR